MLLVGMRQPWLSSVGTHHQPRNMPVGKVPHGEEGY